MLTLGSYLLTTLIAAAAGIGVAWIWSKHWGANARRRRPRTPGHPHQFVHLSIGYSISARQTCFRALPVPLAAHLFHHALEMLFKYALLQRYSQDALALKFGHDLRKLWRQFKVVTGDGSLAAFDDVVRGLDKWERIRYPTFPAGAQAMRYAPTKAAVGPQPGGGHVDPYELVLEEMDELFKAAFLAAPLNPAAFMLQFSGESGAAYRRDNLHPLV